MRRVCLLLALTCEPWPLRAAKLGRSASWPGFYLEVLRPRQDSNPVFQP
jgi:hypothetical protein